MNTLMPPNITKVIFEYFPIYIYTVDCIHFFCLDPDMFEARLVAQQKRTQLLQEKYNTDTQKYLEKQAEKQAEVCKFGITIKSA